LFVTGDSPKALEIAFTYLNLVQESGRRVDHAGIDKQQPLALRDDYKAAHRTARRAEIDRTGAPVGINLVTATGLACAGDLARKVRGGGQGDSAGPIKVHGADHLSGQEVRTRHDVGRLGEAADALEAGGAEPRRLSKSPSSSDGYRQDAEDQ